MNTYNNYLRNNLYVFLKLLIIVEVLKIYYYEGTNQCWNISQMNKKSNTRATKDVKDVKDVKGVKSKVGKGSLELSEEQNETYNKIQTDVKKSINIISKNQDNSSIKDKCKTEKNNSSDLTKGEIHIEKCNDDSLIKNKVKENIKSNVDMERNIKGKIPIIISEKSVFVPIETSLDLEENALEIKGADNNVYLNESILIPIEIENKNFKYSTGKLFLKGFIRNCIQYSTVTSIDDIKIKGDIKHCVNYIPFKCTTLIKYNHNPKLTKRHSRENLIITNPNKIESNQYNYRSGYSEPIYCNLIKVKIFGTRECYNKSLLNNKFPMESTFSVVKEKIIVQLIVQLIQRQEININYSGV